ncbi:hypothetical protein JYU04_01280 [Dehalococcoides mccartyi]|nr:hypothetical protein [Dehalococcoides mccartyi]
MPTVIYTVTAGQLTELKEAIAHHQGVEVSEVSNDDVKEWGLRQFQSIVRRYRQSIIESTNPVSGDPIAS